jgi:hypothetical protein
VPEAVRCPEIATSEVAEFVCLPGTWIGP